MTSRPNKVVWYEGMTLDPQHFQQWDRYHEDRVDARILGLSRLGWGFTDLSIDADRLANGELVLRACSGILPDGLVFDLPDAGPLPTPRPVGEALSSTATEIDAFLAIPTEQPGRGLIQRPLRASTPASESHGDGAPATSHTRFVATNALLRDDTTGADEQSIEVAQTNVQLRFDGESLDGYAVLPVARIRRDGGAFALDASFVPPVLHLDASERLSTIAARTLEMLVTKSRALTERQRDAASQREFAPGDAIRLGMLHLINTHIPGLRHALDGGSDHPERLFHTLSSLAGGLAAYVPALPSPQSLPVYDHSAPTAPFARLFDLICETLMEEHTDETFERIALTQERETLLTATLTTSQLQSGQLLLAARSDARTEDELLANLPHMLRIAAPSNIDQVINHSISALRLEPTRRLPPGMPIDERASYFRLQKDGPFWDIIVQERALAIFLPSEYTDLHLDLVAAS